MLQLSENATEKEIIDFLKAILLANPELFAKRQNDHGCFMRALRRGDPTFTLVAQDRSAVAVVHEWLQQNPQLSPERHQQTVDRMAEMQAWPVKKLAD